jgi:hypothetical protein
MADQKSPLAGRTFRWTFSEGPTARKTYEHTFRKDGTVVFAEVTSGEPAKTTNDTGPGHRYAAFEIAPRMYLVSYLSDHGYTLTVAMNLESKQLHGFASGAKEWYPLEGTVEVVK